MMMTNLAKEVWTFYIQSKHPIEEFFCRRLEGARGHHASEGEKNVDFAKPGNSLLDQFRDGCDIASICLDCNGLV